MTNPGQQTDEATREQQEWLRVTLSSIGDAVITTDNNGDITFLNPVAQSLTGWTQADAAGKPLESVFKIINEATRHTVENPVTKALREGVVIGLANHTLLIAKDGTEWPIDDSADPQCGGRSRRGRARLPRRDRTQAARATSAGRPRLR